VKTIFGFDATSKLLTTLYSGQLSLLPFAGRETGTSQWAGDALRLEIKGRYGSCLVAGKTM